MVHMSGDVSREVEADYCRFCGSTDAEYLGTARTYLRWPADVNLKDAVYHFSICTDCALTERSNTDVAASQFRSTDRDYLGTCYVCGAVGCSSASRRVADDTYRLQSILGWSVEIGGFDGSTSACIECSPVEHVDCIRRPDRTYDEDAPFLAEPPFIERNTVATNAARAESIQVGFEQWNE